MTDPTPILTAEQIGAAAIDREAAAEKWAPWSEADSLFCARTVLDAVGFEALRQALADLLAATEEYERTGLDDAQRAAHAVLTLHT